MSVIYNVKQGNVEMIMEQNERYVPRSNSWSRLVQIRFCYHLTQRLYFPQVMLIYSNRHDETYFFMQPFCKAGETP